MNLGWLVCFLCFFIGLLVGGFTVLFYLERKYKGKIILMQEEMDKAFKQQVKDIFSSLGRKLSEAQMNKIINFSRNKSLKEKK